MERLKDEFLNLLEGEIPLAGLIALEIGCGDGARSAMLAERCGKLAAIDPDGKNVALAQARGIENASFLQGGAEALPFGAQSFDITIFTLSFHHVPFPLMRKVLDEAARVTKKAGHVVFLEPGMAGSLFEAELRFAAGDADERREKRRAYTAMMSHPHLSPQHEMWDETALRFSSLEDFVSSLSPKTNLEKLKAFLERHDYILRAERRINIFKLV